MKIFIISRGLPSKQNPMLGIFEYDQAMALKQYGHEVVLIALDLRSIRHKRKYGIKVFNYNGLDVVEMSVPLGAINKKLFYLLGELALSYALNRAFLLYGQCDLIHAHFIDNAFITAKLLNRKKSDIPFVVTEHSSRLNRPLKEIKKIEKIAAIYAYSVCDTLIAVSESFSLQLKENFHVDSTVIHNIVDAECFISDAKQSEYRKFDFVSVGNLTSNKRMDLLISCFAKCFIDRPDITLNIIGDGPEYQNLKKIIDINKLDNVKLMGKKHRKDIADIFKRSKIFVLLSEFETFGVSFIEAMGAGLPVISTMSGGPETFINNKNGILVNDSEDEIVNALNFMLNNISKYDREEISLFANNNFSPEIIAEKLTLLYREVVKQ